MKTVAAIEWPVPAFWYHQPWPGSSPKQPKVPTVDRVDRQLGLVRLPTQQEVSSSFFWWAADGKAKWAALTGDSGGGAVRVQTEAERREAWRLWAGRGRS